MKTERKSRVVLSYVAHPRSDLEVADGIEGRIGSWYESSILRRVIRPRKLLRPTSCRYYAFRILIRLFGLTAIFGVTFYRAPFIFGSIQFFSRFHSQWIFLRVGTIDGGNMIEVLRKRPKEVYSCELMQRCYQLMQRRSGPQPYFTIFFICVGLASI